MVDFEVLYSAVNVSVMPAWALLIFAPKWTWTEKLIHAAYVPLLLALVYVYFLAWGIFFGAGAEGAGMSTLAKMVKLFDSPVTALGAWVHYLAFDLFVGAWIARDSQRRGIHHILTVPCLLFTYMLGPIGLLLYFIVRVFKGHGFGLQEA